MGFDFKNASKKDLKAEYKKIAKKVGDDQFFTKKELNYLPEILFPKEQVLAFTSGMMDNNTWLLTLTDRRIVFLDKGMIFGLKQTVIDLSKVTAISGETGLMFGTIKIHVGSEDKKITNVWKKTVKSFTNLAEEARSNLSTSSTKVSSSSSKVDDLERLASLRQSGVLTEDEFQSEKSKILAS